MSKVTIMLFIETSSKRWRLWESNGTTNGYCSAFRKTRQEAFHVSLRSRCDVYVPSLFSLNAACSLFPAKFQTSDDCNTVVPRVSITRIYTRHVGAPSAYAKNTRVEGTELRGGRISGDNGGSSSSMVKLIDCHDFDTLALCTINKAEQMSSALTAGTDVRVRERR